MLGVVRRSFCQHQPIKSIKSAEEELLISIDPSRIRTDVNQIIAIYIFHQAPKVGFEWPLHLPGSFHDRHPWLSHKYGGPP